MTQIPIKGSEGSGSDQRSHDSIQHETFEVPVEKSGYLTATRYNQDQTNWATADNLGILRIYSKNKLLDKQISVLGWEQETTLNINQHISFTLNQVTQISCIDWAHPQFGSILVAGTNHGHIVFMRKHRDFFGDGGLAWKIDETVWTNQQIIKDLKFGPQQFGLLVAVAQGQQVRLFRGNEDLLDLKWSLKQELKFQFNNNNINFQPQVVNCVGWRVSGDLHPIMLAVGGDLGLGLWYYDVAASGFLQIELPDEIQVREEVLDLSWCPVKFRKNEQLAVAAGCKVSIFGIKGSTQNLEMKLLSQLQQEGVCNQIAWDYMGLSLVASCLTEPPQSLVWRQNSFGVFKIVKQIGIKN